MLNKILMLCEKKGITITALERELGLGRSTIKKWENSSPSVDNLKKVSDYFGVTIEYFLSEEGGE